MQTCKRTSRGSGDCCNGWLWLKDRVGVVPNDQSKNRRQGMGKNAAKSRQQAGEDQFCAFSLKDTAEIMMKIVDRTQEGITG